MVEVIFGGEYSLRGILIVMCGCNLHAATLYGHDNHHIAESLFKGFGRALDAACQLEPRLARQVPSTKGSLR